MRHRATGYILAAQGAVSRLDRLLKIPRTQAHSHTSTLLIRNQFVEPGLGFLFSLSCWFDGADRGLGLLLRGVGQGVDVVEDVG